MPTSATSRKGRPRRQASRARSISSPSCTDSIQARSQGEAGTDWRRSNHSSRRRWAIVLSRRSLRSGWCGPASCSRNRSSYTKPVVMAGLRGRTGRPAAGHGSAEGEGAWVSRLFARVKLHRSGRAMGSMWEHGGAPTDPSRHQGRSTVEPVVRRPSSARWASAASARGKVCRTSTFTWPLATTSKRAPAQRSSSSRVAT